MLRELCRFILATDGVLGNWFALLGESLMRTFSSIRGIHLPMSESLGAISKKKMNAYSGLNDCPW